MTPVLNVVIVNWNAGEQLRTCLASIAAADWRNFTLGHVVVVDNASTDGSVDRLDALGLPLEILRNTENRGFGAACNQGAMQHEADYILFLNPDAKLLPESLSQPLTFMQALENQGIGICGIQLVDETGGVARTCARFPRPRHFIVKSLGLDRLFPSVFEGHLLERWPHSESREVDHVIGAFYLVRRSVFTALKGFDERFFVYLEDLDFSYRASRAGWRSYYLADVQAFHKGGGTSEQIKARRLFYALRSRIQYGHHHFGRPTALLLTGLTLMVEPFARVAKAAAHRSMRDLREALEGYALLWREVPSLLSKRPDRAS